MNTVTKLCLNHFQKDDIIRKAKGTILKPNAMPSIIKKKRLHPHSDLITHDDFSPKKLKNCHDRTINNICLENIANVSIKITDDGTVIDKTDHDGIIDDINFDNNVNIDKANFDNKTTDKGNLEFISVDEDPILSLIGKYY